MTDDAKLRDIEERRKYQIGPTLYESALYQEYADAHPDVEPTLANLPVKHWSAVVWGVGSMNTHVHARTKGEAERIAIESWDGDGDFDETAFGHLDADAEPA